MKNIILLWIPDNRLEEFYEKYGSDFGKGEQFPFGTGKTLVRFENFNSENKVVLFYLILYKFKNFPSDFDFDLHGD